MNLFRKRYRSPERVYLIKKSCLGRLEGDLKKGYEKISVNERTVDRLNKQLGKAIELAQVSPGSILRGR